MTYRIDFSSPAHPRTLGRGAHAALVALMAVGLGACSAASTEENTGITGDTDGGSWSESSDSSGDGTTAGPTGSTGSGSDSDSGYGTDASGSGTTDPTGYDPTSDESTTGEPDPEETTDTTGEPMACDEQTEVVLYLSPDDSNSMSSPVQARESVLGEVNYLNQVSIRPWEFMNYYTFDYPAAEVGKISLTTELLAVDPFVEGELQYIMQIGVGSESMTNEQRPPMNVTLVLDESGSMKGEPMAMLKESCRAIAASLKEGDNVSVVTWDTENAVRLAGYQVEGPDDPMLLDVIEAITAGGGTDLHGGLQAGYQLAGQVFDPERINRIVLISDGGANVGVTSADLIAEKAGANDEDGIYMVGVGVGEVAGYNDYLMDTVTDLGKGASVFIPHEAEAWKIFNAQFVNTMAVAARDVQVELTMPPGFDIVVFSGEEFSSDPSEIEPQHIAPNDAMVFHQQISTCAPSLVTDETPIKVVARYKDAITFEPFSIEQTITFGDLLGVASPNLLKGAAVFGYSEALSARKSIDDEEIAEKLKAALDALTAAEAALPGDPELAEIRSVLEQL
ncbi:MAG: VWA domain-containing protein [Nannocystaceae bacterium]|nr:VWA domain-containing protein [Myxococcales bacterium]